MSGWALGTVRASFAMYNTKEEIDALVAGVTTGSGKCSNHCNTNYHKRLISYKLYKTKRRC